MTNITIQDLQKADSITELENRELDVINGGAIPVGVAIGIAVGATFLLGVDEGVRLYNATFNDP